MSRLPATTPGVDVPLGDLTLQLLRTQRYIAESSVLADVETEGLLCTPPGEVLPVWDISNLLDARLMPTECIDMASQAVAYGVAVGLFELLGDPPVRVRVLRRPIDPNATGAA